VTLDFIRPGKLTANGMIESFNVRLRDGCQNVNEFVTLDAVKEILKAWMHDYNHCRPYGPLGNLTPSEYTKKWSETDPEAPDSSVK
jgi:putative transposase